MYQYFQIPSVRITGHLRHPFIGPSQKLPHRNAMSVALEKSRSASQIHSSSIMSSKSSSPWAQRVRIRIISASQCSTSCRFSKKCVNVYVCLSSQSVLLHVGLKKTVYMNMYVCGKSSTCLKNWLISWLIQSFMQTSNMYPFPQM